MPSPLPRWDCRFLSFVIPGNDGLPRYSGGSAPTSPFSRPAQRSLALRPACSPSRLGDPLHQKLRQFRYLHCRSDCYRLERPVAGWESHPLKINTFHGALNRWAIVKRPSGSRSSQSSPYPRSQKWVRTRRSRRVVFAPERVTVRPVHGSPAAAGSPVNGPDLIAAEETRNRARPGVNVGPNTAFGGKGP
jgi:hypothetical protein